MPDSLEDNTSCRICMDSTDSYVSLFTHDLSVKVMEVADVQVDKDDGLPETICTQCETDLEKCYEFRLKVQVSDKRFRDNIKYSKVDIEECNIKEEREMDDGNSDNLDDKDSIIMDDDNCNDEPDVVLKNTEEIEEPEPDPMNHVVVIEEKERKVDISEDPDPLRQDEAMMEVLQVKKVEEPPVDPFVCMKEETEIMDIESLEPETFGPSSSVRWTGTPQSFSILLSTLSQGEKPHAQDAQSCKKPASLSKTTSAKDQTNLAQTNSGLILKRQSLNNTTSCMKAIPNMTKLLPGPFNNNPTVSSSEVKSSCSEDTQQTKSQKDDKKQSCKGGRKTIKKTAGKSSCEKLKVCSPPEQVEAKEEDKFFCSVCNVDCGSSLLLQEHKSRKYFICRACTASFDNHSQLEVHFITHKKFTCEFCKKIFHLKKDLLCHKNTVSPCNKKRTRTRTQCKYCPRTFLHRRTLNQHLKLDHNANPEENICLICKTNFKNHTIFITHLKSVHSVYEDIECEICHKILLGPGRLKHHIKTIHIEPTESCPICEKVLTTRSLKSHMEIHDEKETVCNLCGAIVKNKNALRRHLKIHDKLQENKTYTCNLCNETFNSLPEKIRHKKRKHKTKPQPVFCEICGKQYKSMEVLKDHLVTHSDEKPFVCNVCGAAFKTKTVLRTHNRVHTDVRKYSCSRCGEGFRWKQTFDKHMLKCEVHQGAGTESE